MPFKLGISIEMSEQFFWGLISRYRFKSHLDLGPTHAQGENGMKSISLYRSRHFPLESG